MNKLRVLNNSFTTATGTTTSAYIFKMQRLYILAPVFTVGDLLTTGDTVVNIGTLQTAVHGSSNYIDVALQSDSVPMVPNTSNQTATVVTNGDGFTTTATWGERLIPNHPGFTPDNVTNVNRNRTCRALNDIESYQHSHNSLSLIFSNLNVFTSPVNSVVILDHNFTNTAIITIRLLNINNTVLLTDIVTDTTNFMFSTGTEYYDRNSSTSITASDKAIHYKYNDSFKRYLPNSVFNVASVQIDIEDTANTGTLSVGTVYVGDYYEVSTNMTNNWSVDTVDTSTTVYAQSPFSTLKYNYDILSLRFNNVSSDEKQFWLDLYKRNGSNKDFIVDLFNSSPDPNDSYYFIYGRFFSKKFRLVNTFLSRFSLQVSIRESI